MSPNFIFGKKWEKWAKFTYFIYFLIYLVFIKEHSKSGKKMKLNFSIKMHSKVPFPRIDICIMQKSAYGIFFSERRKYIFCLNSLKKQQWPSNLSLLKTVEYLSFVHLISWTTEQYLMSQNLISLISHLRAI